MNNKPSFHITNKILQLSQAISYELGVLLGAKLYVPPIKLRKNNRIKTIHSSLAIEGNTLSVTQITDLINGKRVLAPKKDIIEVNNAIIVYDNLHTFNPSSIESLLEAHSLLMQGLVADNGYWRKGGVAVFKGNQITHLAPAAYRVPLLMEELLDFIKQNDDIPTVIKACLFHYQLEFIHPFSDGNGRMGRLWQQLLLIKANTIFEYISVESLIKDNQSEYYSVLNQCDKLGNATLFIEFMLAQILAALKLYTEHAVPEGNTPLSRMEMAKIHLTGKWFSRKDYILIHKDVSTATASRDLSFGIEQNILIHKGDKNQTYYKFT